MTETANQLHLAGSNVFSGTIKSILEAQFILMGENGKVVRAERAFSCLVTPEVGDRVLVGDTGDRTYVLAVLERPNASESTIELDGDVKMSLPGGKLEITAKEGITLGTPNELDLVAGKLGLSGEALAAAFKKIDIFGDAVEAQLTNVKMFSKKLQSKVGSAVQHFTMRHATVDTVESVKADTIKQTAKGIMSLKSMFSFIKSEKNVKIDGKQIFLA
jgi:hypothetical protein